MTVDVRGGAHTRAAGEAEHTDDDGGRATDPSARRKGTDTLIGRQLRRDLSERTFQPA